jgi:hypothetical protein
LPQLPVAQIKPPPVRPVKKSRDILNKLTTPQREIELGAATIAGQQIDLGAQAATQSGEEAGAKRQDVRRFTAAGERARGAEVTPVPGSLACRRKLLTLMTLRKPQMKWLTKRHGVNYFW